MIVGSGTATRELELLLSLAREQRDRLLVLHSSALEGLGLPPTLPEQLSMLPGELAREGSPLYPWPLPATYNVLPAGAAPWAVVIGPGGWRVDMYVPAWDEAGELETLNPRELEQTLTLYRSLLGVGYRRSPSASGADLLRHVHRRGTRLGPSTTAPPAPALIAGLEADCRYTRELNPAERGRAWVHAYDANARYLGACSALELGLEEPELLDRPRLDPRLPGYWNAYVARPASALEAAAIDPAGSRFDTWAWWSTPALELAAEEQLLGGIRAAWVWERRSRYLTPWYEALRDARARAPQLAAGAVSVALTRLIKRTYTHTIGALAGHWRRPGDDLHRPDWRHAIVAQARANTWRRIRRLPLDRRPFAVDVDAIYLAADTPDPMLAGAELGLGDGPGAFRCTGSAPMAEARQLLDRADAHTTATAGAADRARLEVLRVVTG